MTERVHDNADRISLAHVDGELEGIAEQRLSRLTPVQPHHLEANLQATIGGIERIGRDGYAEEAALIHASHRLLAVVEVSRTRRSPASTPSTCRLAVLHLRAIIQDEGESELTPCMGPSRLPRRGQPRSVSSPTGRTCWLSSAGMQPTKVPGWGG